MSKESCHCIIEQEEAEISCIKPEGCSGVAQWLEQADWHYGQRFET